jgi:transcriptional regulator with XRE-family HTH domain
MELHPEAPIGTDAERVEMHTIHCRVKEIRLARGMSQNELAKRMGCPRTYISKIERKKSTPVLEQVYRLAAALRVTVAHLLNPGLPAGDLAYMTTGEIEERERFFDEVSVLLPEVSLNERQIVLGMAAGLAQGRQPLREWMTV